MTFSFKRVYAIFNKDLKDLSKNMFVLTTVLAPILFAVIFGRANVVPIEIHYLIINLTFATVAAFVQCAIIAEEKEKNTLRGMMMSPASTIEILGGKSLVSIVLTVLTLVLCIRLTGYEAWDTPAILLALFISLIFYIALGTLLGLLMKTLIEASVVIIPIMFIFGMGTLMMDFIQQYPVLAFIEYLPNFQLEFLAIAVEEGVPFAQLAGYLGVLAGWTIVTCVLTVLVYRKRAFDGE